MHEAWLRLEREQKAWENRARFFAAAAEAMRRILIEQARRRMAAKRGGGADCTELSESIIAMQAPDEEILAVHEALETLAAEDARAADLVKLRFFTGMEMQEWLRSLRHAHARQPRHPRGGQQHHGMGDDRPRSRLLRLAPDAARAGAYLHAAGAALRLGAGDLGISLRSGTWK
ncbi:MAG: ECF-type sigma factor [Verrucomicrobiales bacterium]